MTDRPPTGQRPRARGILAGVALIALGVLAACAGSSPSSEGADVTAGSEAEGAATTTTTGTAPAGSGRPITAAEASTGCRGLDLVAIGDLPDAAAPDLVPYAEGFAALAPAELARPALVCAEAPERWRDVVIARLHASARPDGVLITDAVGNRPVLRFTNAEWETYKFRGGDDAAAHNFVGPPRERITVAGSDVIRTTRGGVVMPRPDSFGAVVVDAVWSYWYDEKGYERVGPPTSAPSTRAGIDGAYQDFTTAWGRLPGVSSATEAQQVETTARFVFTDVADPKADRPPDAEGNILQTTGTSWFLDAEGVRHWIDSVEAYDCAREVEGADEVEVRGWVSASYPLGAPYVCPM